MTVRLYTLLCLLLLSSRGYTQIMPSLIPYFDGELWGYSNPSGKVIITPAWENAGLFKNGSAVVSTTTYGRDCSALINEKGRYIIPRERCWNGKAPNGLNMQDKAGKWGMVDSNNRLMIPPLYDGGDFFAPSANGRSVLKVFLNGRYGIIDSVNNILIPPVYQSLVLPWRYAYARKGSHYSTEDHRPLYIKIFPLTSLYDLIIAERDGSKGLIDLHNNVIVPFGKYDDFNFYPPYYVGTRAGRLQGLLDARGEEVFPAVMAALTPVDSNRIIVRIPGDNGGYTEEVVDEQQRVVFPFRGNRSFGVEESELVVTVDSIGYEKDSIGYLYGNRNDSVGESGIYKRRYDPKTLKPVGPWKMELSKDMGYPYKPFCGTAAYQNAGLEAEWAARPLIRFPDSTVKEFTAQGISWWSKTKAAPGLIRVEGCDMADHWCATNDRYTAIVDTVGRFVTAPVKGDTTVLYINIADSLLVCSRRVSNGKSVYAVLDRHLREVIPFQSRPLLTGFYRQGKAYAISSYLPDHPWGRSYQEGEPWKDTPPHDTHLIGSDGTPVKALEHYTVQYSCLRDGNYSPFFGDCLVVADSLQQKGMVTPDGTVVHPAISFRHREFYPVGNGWFLLGDHGRYAWTDSSGREFYPGLEVHEIVPAANSGRRSRGYRHGGDVAPGLYLIRCMMPSGPSQQLYLTANGVVHGVVAPGRKR